MMCICVCSQIQWNYCILDEGHVIKNSKTKVSLYTKLATFQIVMTKNFAHVLNYLNAFSALMLLVGWQEGHAACKKLSGGVLAWLSVWSEVQTCIWPS